MLAFGLCGSLRGLYWPQSLVNEPSFNKIKTHLQKIKPEVIRWFITSGVIIVESLVQLLEYFISFFNFQKVAYVINYSANNIGDSYRNKHIMVSGWRVFCKMPQYPYAQKDKANKRKVLTDDHWDKRETLQIIMEGYNKCGKNGYSKAHKYILCVIFIYKACNLFKDKFSTYYKCEGHTDDGYKIIFVN